MSATRHDRPVSKKLLDSIIEPGSRKKPLPLKRKTKSESTSLLSIPKKTVHKQRQRCGSLHSSPIKIEQILKAWPGRKRRLSPKKKALEPPQPIQHRGANVDFSLDDDCKYRDKPSRIVSYQDISSGKASMSKLPTTIRRFDVIGQPLHLLSSRKQPSPQTKKTTRREVARQRQKVGGSVGSIPVLSNLEEFFIMPQTATLSEDVRNLSPKSAPPTYLPLMSTSSLQKDANDDCLTESFKIELPPMSETGVEFKRVNSHPSTGRSWASYISDWNDAFMGSEQVSEFSEDVALPSRTSWGSDPTSPREDRSNLLEEESSPPPPGMVLVAWINSNENRFSNFPLTSRIESITDWLGASLPVVVDEEGKKGRFFSPKTSLADALGKTLDSPTKQGLAFFIGPVNGRVCYMIKICELSRLQGLQSLSKSSVISKAKEEEKQNTESLETWL